MTSFDKKNKKIASQVPRIFLSAEDYKARLEDIDQRFELELLKTKLRDKYKDDDLIKIKISHQKGALCLIQDFLSHFENPITGEPYTVDDAPKYVRKVKIADIRNFRLEEAKRENLIKDFNTELSRETKGDNRIGRKKDNRSLGQLLKSSNSTAEQVVTSFKESPHLKDWYEANEEALIDYFFQCGEKCGKLRKTKGPNKSRLSKKHFFYVSQKSFDVDRVREKYQEMQKKVDLFWSKI